MRNSFPRIVSSSILILWVLSTCGSAATAQPNTIADANEQRQYEPTFEVSFSATTAIGPNNTWLWEGGFGFNYLLRDHIRIGIEELSYASTSLLSGTRNALSIAPMVEYHTAIASPLELAVGAGVPVQVRFGADLDTKLGAAPFVRVGLDFRTSESFSFGLVERMSYVMSDAYIMTNHGLPNGAAIFATGIALKFHF